MKRRKSYLTNFPTETLFLVLEQNAKELLELEIKKVDKNSIQLQKRINQVKLTISIGKKELINRYLKGNISLNQVANLVCQSNGIRQDIYKELFTRKVIEENELISVDLLRKVINNLELEQIMTIMQNKDTIHQEIAEKRFDEIIYDVEKEVMEELEKKKRMDRRRKI